MLITYMSTVQPLVFVILVNWNNSGETIECLSSLTKLRYSRIHVIVVDNASSDDSMIRLESWKPSYPYTILENQTNEGFTGGNNTGIEYALSHGAEYILMLNNDTVVGEKLLSCLIEDAKKHPEAGILGPSIYFYDQPGLLWFNGGRILLRRFSESILHENMGEKQSKRESEKTDFITGCALMGRADMFRQVGVLDDRFFLYFEDADLNIRAKKAGWEIRLVPDAKIWHKVSVTIKGKLGSNTMIYYNHRNSMLLIEKHASVLLNFYKHIWALGKICKQMIKFLIPVYDRKQTKYILKGIFNYYTRRFGKL